MIRIVVADRDQHVRDHLATVINNQSDLEVVGSAATIDDACAVVAGHLPEVAVLDPGLHDGRVELYNRIRALSPTTRCLLYVTCAQAGARTEASSEPETVLKQLDTSRLIASIRRLASSPPSNNSTADARSRRPRA